jgi:O-methyltransferase
VKNSLAGRLLRAIAGSRGSIVAPLAADWQNERRLIAETRSRTELLLTDPAALQILIAVRAVSSMPAAMAEAGVFKGGSARLICERKGDAPLHLFDVFESEQRGTAPDGEEVRRHFGATHGVQGQVERLLAPYAEVHFHPGLFPASAAGLEHLSFSFVHLDLDLADPTRAALEFFHPRLMPGGILIGDDYSDPAVRECFQDYFRSRPDTMIELPWSQVLIIRQPG